MIMFFILCFVAIYHQSKHLVRNRQIYQLRLVIIFMSIYIVFDQLRALI